MYTWINHDFRDTCRKEASTRRAESTHRYTTSTVLNNSLYYELLSHLPMPHWSPFCLYRFTSHWFHFCHIDSARRTVSILSQWIRWWQAHAATYSLPPDWRLDNLLLSVFNSRNWRLGEIQNWNLACSIGLERVQLIYLLPTNAVPLANSALTCLLNDSSRSFNVYRIQMRGRIL